MGVSRVWSLGPVHRGGVLAEIAMPAIITIALLLTGYSRCYAHCKCSVFLAGNRLLVFSTMAAGIDLEFGQSAV